MTESQARLTHPGAIALAGLACAPAAWASYGQMKLEGVGFALVISALCAWYVVLAIAVAGGGLGRHKWVAIIATVASGLLAVALVMSLGDGSAALRQRPLGFWVMFAVLTMAALPFMLAAPLLQFAWHAQGRPSRLPARLVIAALLLIPLGSLLHFAVQEGLERHAFARARSAVPGQVMRQVTAATHTPAATWLSPFVWTEGEERKWLAIGLGNLPFIDSPAPLSGEDTRAVELAVTSSAGTPAEIYTGKLEGKLVWDRLMRAAPGEREAVAAGLSKAQAQRFNDTIVTPHADWLCVPLADPGTRKAAERLWTVLPENDRRQFSASIRDKCGMDIGAAPR